MENGMIDEDKSLALTPTWALATVVIIMVSLGFFFHASLKRCGKWLDETKRKALLSALEKIKDELMLFGLLSLLMGHWVVIVAKICVKSSAVSSRFFPCAVNDDLKSEQNILDTSSSYTNDFYPRKETYTLIDSHHHCPEGHESFASQESLEQLHRLMFVLGVVHVLYSFFVVALAMIKIYSWKIWEKQARNMATQSVQGSIGSSEAAFYSRRMTRLTTFISHRTSHPWSQNRVLVWLLCFSRQFWSSINYADYMALRYGFITTHELPLTYDFHNFILRSMEEEFHDVVGISWPLWVYAICCIFLNFHACSHQFAYQHIHQQQQQQLQQELQSFWANQYQDIERPSDFKNHSLPLARIKKIMKADEDVRMISAEAPIIFSRACEMFILELTLRSWNHMEENKRRKLQKNDIAAAIRRTDIFDFLVDIVPRGDLKDEVLASVPRGSLPVRGAAEAIPFYCKTLETEVYFWLSFLPAILVLLIGTKLHRIVVKLAVEITDPVPRFGNHPLNLRDELFWFGKPRLLLCIIQLISFQNAFEMATFLWSLWEIRDSSCFMANQWFVGVRLVFGVVSQFWCSFITFPLYIIITQMDAKFKKTVVSENVRRSLHGWKRRVKARHNSTSATMKGLSSTTLWNYRTHKHQIDKSASSSTQGSTWGFTDRTTSYQEPSTEQANRNEILPMLEVPLCSYIRYDSCSENDNDQITDIKG
ncbi:ccaat-binding transcription factor, putative [Ricinus communis]|uniref:Ccaat-binding transcription factor, putative n=1 Tax=Ricinus communis TaxID=3988 RepID=B9SUH9_RICCO|nr:ccaat-binding transcription factor, putative [Ricinus communis]